MIENISISGLIAPSGARYVYFKLHEAAACIPINRFVVGAKGAGTELAEAGIPIFGNAAWAKITDRISKIEHWTEANIIERVGWNGASFTLPDGSVFQNDGQRFIVAFERHRNKCSEKGTIKAWKKSVARPLQGQQLAVFTLMLAFMPPLLALTQRVGNFGFEIVGRKGTGKSTLQHLMSSVLGGAIQGDDGHYWISLDTTLNAIEDVMPVHSDMPIIMDEANLLAADATRQVKAARFQAIAFKLGYGSQKGRLGAPATRDYRLGFLISSNEPLASLIGTDASARAAADRLITLSLNDDRTYGVFDFVPKRYGSASNFARSLIAAANDQHGTAFRRFIKGLVEQRANDEEALKAEIEDHLSTFRDQTGVDGNDGSARRIVDAFGLVFAAGKLAKKYGALPKQLHCGEAALACYRLYQGHNESLRKPFADRLRDLAACPEALRLNGSPAASIDEIKDAQFLLDKGDSHLLIYPNKIERMFPDWDAIKHTDEVAQHLKRDGAHLKVKKKVIPGEKPKRLFCFKLPHKATGQVGDGKVRRTGMASIFDTE